MSRRLCVFQNYKAAIQTHNIHAGGSTVSNDSEPNCCRIMICRIIGLNNYYKRTGLVFLLQFLWTQSSNQSFNSKGTFIFTTILYIEDVFLSNFLHYH